MRPCIVPSDPSAKLPPLSKSSLKLVAHTRVSYNPREKYLRRRKEEEEGEEEESILPEETIQMVSKLPVFQRLRKSRLSSPMRDALFEPLLI